MEVSRCCCGNQKLLCEEGLSYWFDDFSTYVEGQDLTSIYETGINSQTVIATSGTGSVDSGAGVSVALPVWLIYPFDPYFRTSCDFEITFSTAPNAGGVFMWQRPFGFGTGFSMEITWNNGGAIGGGDILNCITGSPSIGPNTSNHAIAVNDGDVLRIRVEKISYSIVNSGQLESTAYFYRNGSLITSRLSYNHSGESKFAWCNRRHGVVSFGGPFAVDNWNFTTDT